MGAPSGSVAYAKGDVVLVTFPFTDLSSAPLRPALVLASLPTDDLLVCQITSQVHHAMSVKLIASDFASGSLHRDSYIRPGRLFTLHRSIIVRKVGTVTSAKLQEVVTTLIQLLTT